MSDTRPFVVFIEPHAALFRYLAVARRRFRTLVLTPNADQCAAELQRVQQDMGQPGHPWIDMLMECDTTNVEAMFDRLQPCRSVVAGVLAGDDPFVPVAAQLGLLFGFDYA